MKKAWFPLCAAALLLCVSAVTARNVVILKDARIRAEPDMNAPFTIALEGDTLPLLEHSGPWYKVRANGEEGWVYSELVRIIVDGSGQGVDLFTRQDLTVPPPDLDMSDELKIQYARPLKTGTIVQSHIDPNDPNARILRTIRGRDEIFPIVHMGASWGLIMVKVRNADGEEKDTVGWVRSAEFEVFDEKPTKSALLADAKVVGVILGGLGAVVLILLLVITLRHLHNERLRNVYVQKNVLILSKVGKSVQYTLTNVAAPIEHCFSELGFNVALVKDSVVARNNIEHNTPDLILVDWNFEPAIFAKIENLLSRLSNDSDTHLLFFNVPDVSAAPASKTLRNVSFLGLTVTDRDIFKVVTPLLVHADQPSKNIQKSQQRCALEGEIAGGNLLEVLQFIEVGSKTGCLMVETKGPFGLVYFRDGRIVYAAAAKGQGVEAVYAILNQPSGKFRFITNKQPKTANLNLPTLSVLMEWTRLKDEAKRT